MSALGYNYKNSVASRHRALNKGLKKYGYSNLMHKLTFMLINKNKIPKMYKTVKEDMNWLKMNKG